MRLFFTFLLVFFVWCPMQAQEEKTAVALQEYYERGIEYINNFQFDRALDLLRICYKEDPQNPQYLARIAHCHVQLGHYAEAKLFYNTLLQLDSTNTQAIGSLGAIFERENNYREALRYYVYWAALDSTNSFAFKRSGYCAVRTGRGLEGRLFFARAHDLNPADIETIHQLSTLYIQSDQLENAEQLLNIGLAIDATNTRLLQNQARLASKRKNYPTVIQAIEKTMAQGDTSEYYQTLLGIAYLQIDSLDKGIFHFEEIIRREEDSDQTHHYLGLAYRQQRNLKKSIEHFEIAIQKGISEEIDTYYADLGAVYESQGSYRTAIESYQKAQTYEAKPKYLFFEARNHDLAYKDKSKALKLYQQYLATKDPEFKEYAEKRILQLKEIIQQSK